MAWLMLVSPWSSQLYPNDILVGGLEHFHFSIYWEEWSQLTFTHIFQRGRSTTNQYSFLIGFKIINQHHFYGKINYFYGHFQPVSIKSPGASPGATVSSRWSICLDTEAWGGVVADSLSQWDTLATPETTQGRKGGVYWW